jgi:FimV-like protein
VETADIRPWLDTDLGAAELAERAFAKAARPVGFERPAAFDARQAFLALGDLLKARGLSRARIGLDLDFWPVADFEFRLDGLLDERRTDITTSTPTAPTAGHLASARTTTPSVSASYTASDSANTLEFNLSDSFSSSMPVSNSSLSPVRSAATAQKPTGLAMHEGDLASLKTKFDLAIACQEIGDHEGARELLAEVAVSQHPELAERAQSLLSQLA